MIGETINQYKIIEHLGSGGMGEVYLAVDSKLDRKVALKFLPAQVSADADAKARFLQEARAASALNHPNICTIHDIQDHDGRLFIVMEYIDGQTLRERQAPFSLKQVIEIGIQVADGLAAAHEKGIIHRDIKTENIMMRKDGIVQIMDFGLAKLRGASRLTKEGSTIGTMGYMSPEQVQGLDADHRTDLFSLGVVLYELLTGQLPFKGVHETAIMYEIVHVDPQPLSAIKPDFDPELDRIILECLQKDPDERCQSAKEVSRDLRRFKSSSGQRRVSRVSTVRPAYTPNATPTLAPEPATMTHTPPRKPSRSRMGYIPWGVAAVLTVALAVVLFWSKADTESRGAVRFVIPSPEGMGLVTERGGNIAISPNGRLIAFCTIDSLQDTHLWLRPVDEFEAQQLPGTERAYYPFWSPDSRYVGFFTLGGKLKKIDVTGGPPINLCDAPSGRGGSWNSEGTIIFSAASVSPLLRVSSAGGVPTEITNVDTTGQNETHRWPWFLPDGNRFLYYVRMGGGGIDLTDDTVWVGSLDGSVNRPLMQSEGNAYYANGLLYYTREKTLMAQPCDIGKDLQLGEPFPVAEEVQVDSRYNIGAFSVSKNGALTYITGSATIGSWLVRYDRDGSVIDTLGDLGQYGNCGLSPDGTRFAFDFVDPTSANQDIWVIDLIRGVKTRLTFDGAADMSPVWSPDGDYIMFASRRGGQFDIYRKNSSGAGDAELVLQTTNSRWPVSYASDQRTLMIYGLGDKGVGDDLWSLPLDPETGLAGGDLTVFQQTDFDEDDAHLSPDGRWVSFTSNETGQYEVYVRPFPGPGGKWQISTDGGDFSAWRSDGRELYYLAPDGGVMVVDVDGSGSSFKAGEPSKLFAAPAISTNVPWSVTENGEQFIINCRGQAEGTNAINVIVNLDAEIAAR
jgi:serine/threonine protein kinase/Tol biopolymer transport system component